MDKLGAQHFQEAGEVGTVRFVTTNLPWMTDLVMGFQDKVRVLGPQELKAEVKRRIEKMSEIYKGDS